MNESQMIWRFGRWIGGQEGGAAHLRWSGGEMILRLLKSKIICIEGLDIEQLVAEVGGTPSGQPDLLQEARLLAERRGVPETQVLAAAKRMFCDALLEWLLDPQRELETVLGEPDATEGPTISITHALVELILSDPGERLIEIILPDLDVLLRRNTNFLTLYSPLRLSEEADLIVAKITGQRTAREIGLRSPHGTDDILRLLAALIATGMLEPVPVAAASDDLDLIPREAEPEEVLRRPLPIGWIAAGAVLIVVLLGIISLILSRSHEPPPAVPDGTWAIVVDFGCEPADLQRVLRKQGQNPRSLQVITIDVGGQECGHLVWSSFGSQEQAQQAIADIPEPFVQEDFEPHPIKISDSAEPGAGP